MRRSRLVAVARAVVVLLAGSVLSGCGGAASEGSGSPLEVPDRDFGEGETVVFQVVVMAPGVEPVEAVRPLPELTVTGNGRVIVTRPDPAGVPAPALPVMERYQISRPRLDELFVIAKGGGLLEGAVNFGSGSGPGLPTTTVYFRVDGEPYVWAVEGLDETTGAGLAPEQGAARQALRDLVAKGRSFAAEGLAEPYVAEQLAVFSAPYEAVQPAPPPDERQWPLDTLTDGEPVTPAPPYTCRMYQSIDARSVITQASQATGNSRWIADDMAYSVAFRPLVPGEGALC